METEDSKNIQLDPLGGEARSVNHLVSASINDRLEERRMQCNAGRLKQSLLLAVKIKALSL